MKLFIDKINRALVQAGQKPVTADAVYRWRRGSTRPRAHHCFALELVTGIRACHWSLPEGAISNPWTLVDLTQLD